MRVGNGFLLVVIQYVLCAVSMVLTALFALSFSTSSLGLPFSVPGEAIIAPVLMVVVGVSLDAIKYLFWGTGTFHFQISSLVLVFFSWAASVAFFVTQDDAKVERARVNTPAYQAYLVEKNALEQQISQKAALVELKSNSQFHKQWQESERLSNELVILSEQLNQLLLDGGQIGFLQAKGQLTSSAFFDGIGRIANVPGETIRNVFFAVLALLLELGSIGMISLRLKAKKYRAALKQDASSAISTVRSQDDLLGGLNPRLASTAGFAEIDESVSRENDGVVTDNYNYKALDKKPLERSQSYLSHSRSESPTESEGQEDSSYIDPEIEEQWQQFVGLTETWQALTERLPIPLPMTRSDVMSCQYLHRDEKRNTVFKWMGKISHPISRFRKVSV